MAEEFLQTLEDDLDIFLNPDEFAVTVEYNAVLEGEVVEISGLWDDPFATANPETQMNVQSKQQTLRVKEHEIPGGKVRPGDFFTIIAPALYASATQYFCKESQPDGVGLVTILAKSK
ncbi:MAG: hypothetical protein R3209_03025 [Salinimicrobium sediminis]|nr:hypothetical protein [Salinimicrobium sediminis]